MLKPDRLNDRLLVLNVVAYYHTLSINGWTLFASLERLNDWF